MGFDPVVTPGALDAFHAWLTKSGVKLGDNAVLSGRSPLAGGRGLIATKPIENGQSVLAVPLSLGLTAAGLERSGIAKHVAGFEGWTGDTGLIALQILWEKAQGEGSKMAPWIAVLPAMGELGMPLFWDEADLTLADASSTRVRVFLKSRVLFPTCHCGCFRLNTAVRRHRRCVVTSILGPLFLSFLSECALHVARGAQTLVSRGSWRSFCWFSVCYCCCAG